MASSLQYADIDAVSEIDAADDALFAALSNRRRRIALSSLAGCSQAVTVTALAADVAAAVPDAAPDPDSVATRLYHVHLPRLEAADLVDLDREATTVAPTEAGEELAAALTSTGQ